ncbi:MAG: alpha-glucuronidase, partial [Lachnospiraceae bacterium]|nr:alpha-glucuronidase [Lachnospiraceae bacterium]
QGILNVLWEKKIYVTSFAKIQEKDIFVIRMQCSENLHDGGYHIWEKERLYLEASTECGILYGIFDLLRMLSLGKDLAGIDVVRNPEMPLRMLNHWDNMDGSIERGYSGASFFFQKNEILAGKRTCDYARMISGVGINAIVINNVNVMGEAKKLITKKHMRKLNELSTILDSYGIKTFLSLNFMSPIDIGGLDSADPFNDEVRAWWKGIMEELFKNIKGLGGFLIKADSEGRPGPYLYGRTQADGANMLAKIIDPYHGIIIWRCFVYNNMQDWRDYETDRAKAGYDNFNHTDGEFLDNVILQIKNGPMDFQIREPVSPLLGSMRHTNQMLEVQLAQEYTGQQIDLCYLVPLIKEVLEFRTYHAPKDTVADIISGKAYGNHNTGIAAVSNTGDSVYWTGNPLAALNLYGFGRLSFDPGLTAEEIADEWIRLSLTSEEKVVSRIKKIIEGSRETYEKYTSPLGIGWMVMPGEHYGCCVDGYEYSRFGT